MTPKNGNDKKTLLKELRLLYRRALKNNKVRDAVHISEMLAKHLGFFQKQKLPEIMSISDMNEEQLNEFLTKLEEYPSAPKHRTDLSPEEQQYLKETGKCPTCLMVIRPPPKI